jgi:hypothetical protein
MRTGLPTPQAAWPLDGSVQSSLGDIALRGYNCSWTDGHAIGTRALSLSGCFGIAAHSASLAFGSGSLTACARFRSATRGTALISKLSRVGRATRGFSIELGEDRGLGVSLADATGVSAHEELGRTNLADGQWHHACVVLSRPPRPQLAVYVDGKLSESLSLRASRLRHLGSLDNEAPLLFGRKAIHDGGSGDGMRGVEPSSEPEGGGGSPGSALGEVAVWSRALFPEQVALLFRSGLPSDRRKRHARGTNERPSAEGTPCRGCGRSERPLRSPYEPSPRQTPPLLLPPHDVIGGWRAGVGPAASVGALLLMASVMWRRLRRRVPL